MKIFYKSWFFLFFVWFVVSCSLSSNPALVENTPQDSSTQNDVSDQNNGTGNATDTVCLDGLSDCTATNLEAPASSNNGDESSANASVAAAASVTADSLVVAEEAVVDSSASSDSSGLDSTSVVVASEEATDSCSGSVDEDGDGLPCNCDENDSRVIGTGDTVKPECDQDGDGVPDMYDINPTTDDTGHFNVNYLCGPYYYRTTGYDYTNVSVAYDSDKWSVDDCDSSSGGFKSLLFFNPDLIVSYTYFYRHLDFAYTTPSITPSASSTSTTRIVVHPPSFPF